MNKNMEINTQMTRFALVTKRLSLLLNSGIGEIVQLVEQWDHNPYVEGSSPSFAIAHYYE